MHTIFEIIDGPRTRDRQRTASKTNAVLYIQAKLYLVVASHLYLALQDRLERGAVPVRK